MFLEYSLVHQKKGEADLGSVEGQDPLGVEYTILATFLTWLVKKMYGLAAWKSWVTTKNAELAGVSSSRNMKMICDDLLSMNCEELNYALCLFLKDLRKKNGELYQPDTVFYLLLGEYCAERQGYSNSCRHCSIYLAI
ncbi:Zinc finger MYM-type protein 2 [Portunus trituberculatus]|uniref:Zinc finger MYM-type protein 2 n=1 Tax=Portunus trituberculatus TaxID=210409 RepID=A0A5B7ERV4_PORTR|nr:Zinc finger MYM-type protein 2 [Portunus trituberculatus]